MQKHSQRIPQSDPPELVKATGLIQIAEPIKREQQIRGKKKKNTKQKEKN